MSGVVSLRRQPGLDGAGCPEGGVVGVGEVGGEVFVAGDGLVRGDGGGGRLGVPAEATEMASQTGQ